MSSNGTGNRRKESQPAYLPGFLTSMLGFRGHASSCSVPNRVSARTVCSDTAKTVVFKAGGYCRLGCTLSGTTAFLGLTPVSCSIATHPPKARYRRRLIDRGVAARYNREQPHNALGHLAPWEFADSKAGRGGPMVPAKLSS